ncbi:MAG: DUF2958 domain-containing protein [SAR324 cluster bacterium]|nr:DUF2958 domain-containing protein [SAR324 cluster bacterium]
MNIFIICNHFQSPYFSFASLTEMESVKGPLGIGIEPDLYFVQKRFSEVKK